MFYIDMNIFLVRSIMLTKLALRSDLVGDQLFYLISLTNAEKRSDRDDKSRLPLQSISVPRE